MSPRQDCRISQTRYTFHMDKDAREIVDTLNFIVTRMVTKEDLANMATKEHLAAMATKTDIADLRAEMNEGFASIRTEIRDIRQQIDAIEAELKNHAGFAKEIDLLMDRVRTIEKHLSIKPIAHATGTV